MRKLKGIDKKIHNVAVRFFGDDYDTQPEFKQFVQKILDIATKDVVKRIERLEKTVNKKWSMPVCDNCGKAGKWQCGTNDYGNIATWCSYKCFYKKNPDCLPTPSYTK